MKIHALFFYIRIREKEKATMTEKLKNAGYTIIERFTVGERALRLDIVKQRQPLMSHGSIGPLPPIISSGGII